MLITTQHVEKLRTFFSEEAFFNETYVIFDIFFVMKKK